MDNKFNMTESEKNRIRGLHSINEQSPGTSRVISESFDVAKISSVITTCVASNVGMAGIAKLIGTMNEDCLSALAALMLGSVGKVPNPITLTSSLMGCGAAMATPSNLKLLIKNWPSITNCLVTKGMKMDGSNPMMS